VKISDIIWTEKMEAVMNDDAQIILLNGATGCSKSLIAGHKFADWLLNAGENETQFYMIFKDVGTGVRNVIHNKDSFYNLFDFCREEYTSSKDGGGQFVFHGIHGDKTVYIVGADNKNAWSKILGSNPDGLWLEELSVLHIDCIREAFGRAFSRRCKLISTTNGGLPTQEFYTEFTNHAKVMMRENVPMQELSEMIEDKPYMHYYHFNLEDDAPHLTDDEREKLKELYPTNSFYYYSKILGCRGFVEGSAYAQLMQKHLHLIENNDIVLENLKEIMLVIDVGSNRDIEDTSKASTVATLVGFSKDYQRVIVLECWIIPSVSHDHIISECEKKIEWWWVRHMGKFSKIIIDSAESILINTWREKNRYNTIRVKGSVKSVGQEITLVTRCQLKQQLLVQERLLWSTNAINSYNAHTRILLDEDGKELDLSVQDNDIGDSLAYGLTENWNKLTKQTSRRA
jgi:PBSX family phage terminase large subunit